MLLFSVCCVLFLIHNISLFWYLSQVFVNTASVSKITCLLSILFNFGMLSLAALSPAPEWICMIVYLALFTVETKLIFRDKWLKTVFGAACFSLNFFCLKLIYTVVYSFLTGQTITFAMQSEKAGLLILAFTLLTNIPYTIAFKMFFPQSYMDSILSDKSNLKFVSMIVGLIYIYLILNTKNLYVTEPFDIMLLFQLKIAVCALFGFIAAFVYAYLFARMQLYAAKSKQIEEELDYDEKAMRVLENKAYHDDFTGCFTREYAENEIDRLLERHSSFSLIFMDVDGLKTTNDEYGHDEGDFYIRSIADILKQEFSQNIVARMGGDEFLVIMEEADSYDAAKSSVRSYNRAKELGKEHDKPYLTSVSYGIVEVESNTAKSRSELIELADSRMYSLKKSRHRNRTATKY